MIFITRQIFDLLIHEKIGFKHFNSFRASIDEVDYMENQCVESPIRQGACEYSEYENQDIGYADLQIPAKTKEEVNILVSASFVNSVGQVCNFFDSLPPLSH